MEGLASDTLQLWTCRFDEQIGRIAELWELLSAAERTRAEAFHFSKDSREFIIGRGVLRELLGGCLGCDPASIGFKYHEHGKPALNRSTSLRFNLSHSGGLVVYAFGLEREIGVDVEEICDNFDLLAIAERFFSDYEREQLRAVEPALRPRAFFNAWTRKEAFLKARGDGLTLPLDQFDVSLRPDDRPKLLRTGWNELEAAAWSLLSFSPDFGYVAAVAIQGPAPKLHFSRVPAAAPTPILAIRR